MLGEVVTVQASKKKCVSTLFRSNGTTNKNCVAQQADPIHHPPQVDNPPLPLPVPTVPLQPPAMAAPPPSHVIHSATDMVNEGKVRVSTTHLSTCRDSQQNVVFAVMLCFSAFSHYTPAASTVVLQAFSASCGTQQYCSCCCVQEHVYQKCTCKHNDLIAQIIEDAALHDQYCRVITPEPALNEEQEDVCTQLKDAVQLRCAVVQAVHLLTCVCVGALKPGLRRMLMRESTTSCNVDTQQL